MLTTVSGPRLLVESPAYWRCVARLVAPTVPARSRPWVSALLLCGDPGALDAAREVAEWVIRATVPGRLSLALGLDAGVLSVMALDLSAEARRAFTAALLAKLEGEGCRGK